MRFALASENSDKVWSFGIDMTMAEFEYWYNNDPNLEYQYESPVGTGRIMTGNKYADFISAQEDHGVLDIGSVNEIELYHSYEIEEDMFPVILENFREFFRKNGLKVQDDLVAFTLPDNVEEWRD